MAGAARAVARGAALDGGGRAARARRRTMNVQVPPNLSYDDFPRLLDAGINDWGGVSPVTIDHVNPEAPWPEIERLRAATEAPRARARAAPARSTPSTSTARGSTPRVLTAALRSLRRGRPRARGRLVAGRQTPASRSSPRDALPVDTRDELGEEEIVRLFAARGEELHRVFAAADRLRREVNGDDGHATSSRGTSTTRTSATSSAASARSRRGSWPRTCAARPTSCRIEEIVRRAHEAWERGAVEVCLQGGIHPASTATTTSRSCEAIKDASCRTCTCTRSRRSRSGRARRRSACRSTSTSRGCATSGLASLPGTAAEILDDEVRARHLPGQGDDRRSGSRCTTRRTGWACARPTRSCSATSTAPRSWARHLLRVREQQQRDAAASRSSSRCRSCTWRRRST